MEARWAPRRGGGPASGPAPCCPLSLTLTMFGRDDDGSKDQAGQLNNSPPRPGYSPIGALPYTHCSASQCLLVTCAAE